MYDAVTDMRKRLDGCAMLPPLCDLLSELFDVCRRCSKAIVVGYGHLGDSTIPHLLCCYVLLSWLMQPCLCCAGISGNLHLNVSTPTYSKEVFNLIEPYLFEQTGKLVRRVRAALLCCLISVHTKDRPVSNADSGLFSPRSQAQGQRERGARAGPEQDAVRSLLQIAGNARVSRQSLVRCFCAVSCLVNRCGARTALLSSLLTALTLMPRCPLFTSCPCLSGAV